VVANSGKTVTASLGGIGGVLVGRGVRELIVASGAGGGTNRVSHWLNVGRRLLVTVHTTRPRGEATVSDSDVGVMR
jgi:hypothetical protein